MFDTGNHGNAVKQLLKQFLIIKENKILVSLELKREAIMKFENPSSCLRLPNTCTELPS